MPTIKQVHATQKRGHEMTQHDRAAIDRLERLLDEMAPYTQDDDEGTVAAFRPSDDLLSFLHDHEVSDLTDARDYLLDIIEDHLEHDGVWVQGGDLDNEQAAS